MHKRGLSANRAPYPIIHWLIITSQLNWQQTHMNTIRICTFPLCYLITMVVMEFRTAPSSWQLGCPRLSRNGSWCSGDWPPWRHRSWIRRWASRSISDLKGSNCKNPYIEWEIWELRWICLKPTLKKICSCCSCCIHVLVPDSTAEARILKPSASAVCSPAVHLLLWILAPRSCTAG